MAHTFELLPSQFAFIQRIKHIIFHAPEHGVLTILGKKGSGKTTLSQRFDEVLPDAEIHYFSGKNVSNTHQFRAEIFQAVFNSALFDEQYTLAENYLEMIEYSHFHLLTLFVIDDVDQLSKSVVDELYDLQRVIDSESFQFIFTAKPSWLSLLTETEQARLTTVDIPDLLTNEKETLLAFASHINFDFEKMSLEKRTLLQDALPKTPGGVLETAKETKFLLKHGVSLHKKVFFACLPFFIISLICVLVQAKPEEQVDRVVLVPIDLAGVATTNKVERPEEVIPVIKESAQTVTKPQIVVEEKQEQEAVPIADQDAVTSSADPTEIQTEIQKQKPTTGYGIQLISLSNETYLKTFLAQFSGDPALFTLKDRHLHLVVYGQFATKQEAEQVATQLLEKYQSSKPWVRSWASLQQYPLDLI